MNATAPHAWRRRGATIAVTALAALWVGAFLWVALARIAYPFELDWMGGAFVDHVCRVLDGEPLYVAPSPDFVPFLYGPLYFHAAAVVARVTGEGFLPLRLVSLVATLAVLAVAGIWTARRTGSWPAGAVAVGAYAGGYFLVDTYYDVARTDALFVSLALCALVVGERGTRLRSAIVAGLVLVLAYHAKQTALLLAPPFAIAIGLRDLRRGLAFAGVFAVAWTASFLVLDARSEGWFSFYTWTLPRRHQYDWSIAIDALWIDLRALWPMFGIALWLGVRRWRTGRVRELLVDGAWAGGLLLAALSSRAHLGGAVNVLAPAVLACGLVGGLAWHEAVRAGGRSGQIVAWLLALQLALLALDLSNRDERHPPRLVEPARWIPTTADRTAGERILALLRQADGDVLVPWHGYLPRMAGKRGGAHVMALVDLETERSGEPELWQELHRAFLDSARTRNAELLLLDADLGMPEYRLGELVYPGYAFEGGLFAPGDDSFQPVVGLQTRPTSVWRRAR